MNIDFHLESSRPRLPSTTGRRYLSSEGYKLLQRWFDNVTHYPDASQRAEILAQLCAIGCTGYDETKLKGWFAGKRQTKGLQGTKRMSSGSHALDEAVRNQTKILFPQFSDEATTKLFQLLRQDPQPSESSLSVWATQLRLDLGEVKNWTIIAQDLLQKHPIPIKQEKQPFTPSSHNQSSPPFARAPYPSRNVPVQQLPTPASSISPEPLSPQLARAQAVPQPSQPLPLPAAQLVGLADVLNDALHQDPSTVFPKPPQSLDEFARMMEPHNKRSSDFLRRITSGEYEEFGLKASFVKPL